MFSLQPPRHIPTLPKAADTTADWAGPLTEVDLPRQQRRPLARFDPQRNSARPYWQFHSVLSDRGLAEGWPQPVTTPGSEKHS